MNATAKTLRYKLPKKAIKSDCPQCAPKHRKSLSRYVDAQTGESLPDIYGRCDRESNCGYHLSPYHKGSSGLSYHDEQKALNRIGTIPKEWFRMAGKQKRNGVTKRGFVQCLMEMEAATMEQAERVANYVFDKPDHLTQTSSPDNSTYAIPDEVFRASLGHYEQNQLAKLLIEQVGAEVAAILLNRFKIGTSSRWPGACVFWYVDEKGRKRGGQIKLFGDDFHTVKYKDKEGQTRSKTSWVHSALIRRYTQKQQPIPDWLTEYDEKADRSPCLFGLPQLKTEPIDKPIAIVEAPKTAILCSHYFPQFIWMAVGGKSYLTAERLAPLKGRKIALYPDLNAYADLVNEKGQINKGWLTKSKELQADGFTLTVSDFLENLASDEDLAKGLDLADYLLRLSSEKRPYLFLFGRKISGEVLEVEPCDSYPAEWDENGISTLMLVSSPNREEYAKVLGVSAEKLPLYSFQSVG